MLNKELFEQVLIKEGLAKHLLFNTPASERGKRYIGKYINLDDHTSNQVLTLYYTEGGTTYSINYNAMHDINNPVIAAGHSPAWWKQEPNPALVRKLLREILDKYA